MISQIIKAPVQPHVTWWKNKIPLLAFKILSQRVAQLGVPDHQNTFQGESCAARPVKKTFYKITLHQKDPDYVD